MQVFMVVIKMTKLLEMQDDKKKVAPNLIDVSSMVFIVAGIAQVEEAL